MARTSYEEEIITDDTLELVVNGSEHQNGIRVFVRLPGEIGSAALLEKTDTGGQARLHLVENNAAGEVIEIADSNGSRHQRGVRLREEGGSNAEKGSQADIMQLYLADIGQYSLIDKYEEARLAKLIEAGKAAQEELGGTTVRLTPAQKRRLICEIDKGFDAKRDFINANYRLVVSVARTYYGSPLPLLDRIQAGNLGMMHAVEKFDWRKGFKFSTYATWWIMQSISRGIVQQTRNIHLPLKVFESVHAVQGARFELEIKLGRRPSQREIADHTHMSLEEVNSALMHERDATSLNQELTSDTETELGDMIYDRSAITTEAAGIDSVYERDTEDIYRVLNERERQVIRLAIDCGLNTKEISKELGITAVTALNIHNAAQSKIRHPSNTATTELLKHTGIDTHWREKAVCLGLDTPLFFPVRGEVTNEAKEVCAGCPSKNECTDDALRHNDKFGIWGGLSERERRRLRRQRSQARRRSE